MGRKTKIDWCDNTWNPVTGCLHGCEYCYARRIAERFGNQYFETNTENGYECDIYDGTGDIHCLDFPIKREWKNGKTTVAPYPFSFDPTFYRYRLDELKRWNEPRNIFVCSMADLFGEWVPDEWIKTVFYACLQAPQHRYMFLTKNPKRYLSLAQKGDLPKSENMWYGSSTPTPQTQFWFAKNYKTFLSIEPILEPFTDMGDDDCFVDWIIVGAETGNRKNKVFPEKKWIDELLGNAKRTGTPIFMKDSLREIMGDDFKQEFPWRV